MLANIIKAIRLDLGHKDQRLPTEIVEDLFMPLNFDRQKNVERLRQTAILESRRHRERPAPRKR